MENVKTVPVIGYEVYHSEEFKALCERFGIPRGLKTVKIVLTLTQDLFTVDQQFIAEEQVPYADPNNRGG